MLHGWTTVSLSGVRNSSASRWFRHCNNGGKLLFSILGEKSDPRPQDGLDIKIEVTIFVRVFVCLCCTGYNFVAASSTNTILI